MLLEDKKIEFFDKVYESIKKQGNYSLCVVTSTRNKLVEKKLKKYNLDFHLIEVPEYDKSKQVTSFEIAGSVGWNTQDRLEVAYLRNYALGLDSEIFFVDSDVVLPEKAVERLKKEEGDVVLGWYFCRSRSNPVLVGDKIVEKIKKGKPFKVVGGGIGCSLFRKVEKRFSLYGATTEDVPLLKKLEKVICVPSVYCEHLGYFKPKALEYKDKMIKQWKIK